MDTGLHWHSWQVWRLPLGLCGDTEFVWTVTAAVGVKTGTFDEGGSKGLAVDFPFHKGPWAVLGQAESTGWKVRLIVEFWVKSELIIGSCPIALEIKVGSAGSYSKILSTKTHLRPAVCRGPDLASRPGWGKMQIFSERMQLLTRSRSRHTQHAAATGKGTHPLSEPSLPPATSSSGVSFVARLR